MPTTMLDRFSVFAKRGAPSEKSMQMARYKHRY
jgi:hypothetical protein